MSSALSFRSKRSQRNLRSRHNDWSCLPCADPIACFGSYENIYTSAANCFGKQNNSLTESQAMDHAMALAAEYVQIANQYPVLTARERDFATAIRNSNNLFFSNAANMQMHNPARTSSSSSDSSATKHTSSTTALARSFDFIEQSLPMPIQSTRSELVRPPTASSFNANADTLYGSIEMALESKHDQTQSDKRPPTSSKIRKTISRHGRRLRSLFA